MLLRTLSLTLLSAAVLTLGCTELPEDWPVEIGESIEPTFDVDSLDLGGAYVLTADIESGDDSDVRGTIALIQKANEDTVRVTGEILGLAPGLHGFHIHESGDCSAGDFTSAGPHFNPEGDPHGAPSDESHHAGDLGNLEADENGVATPELEADEISLVPGSPNSVLTRSVIIHEDADDVESQPSGEAGVRVGCGVLRLHKTPEHALETSPEEGDPTPES